jgi:hypothetical protein
MHRIRGRADAGEDDMTGVPNGARVTRQRIVDAQSVQRIRK